MDDKLTIYRAWAPKESPWAPWVKPVLFAHLPFSPTGELPPELLLPDLDWLATLPASTVVVFDLPGASSVRAGLKLARMGLFQPIPLHSSCPPDMPGNPAAVSTAGTLCALQELAPEMATLASPGDRRPVFLVDAKRWDPDGFAKEPDIFDNRSAVFSSDFPPAEVLRARGIQNCTIARDPSIPVSSDLLFALAPWRKAGIEVDARSLEGKLLDLVWPSSGFLGSLLHRARLMLSLRPNPSGGFGQFVAASAGG